MTRRPTPGEIYNAGYQLEQSVLTELRRLVWARRVDLDRLADRLNETRLIQGEEDGYVIHNLRWNRRRVKRMLRGRYPLTTNFLGLILALLGRAVTDYELVEVDRK